MNKVIGLDLGSVTCGVAVSDELGFLAHPVKTIRFKEHDIDPLLNELETLLESHQVKVVVLGLPLHMNGDVGERARASLEFKEILEEAFGVEVIMMDERFSTRSSERQLISMNVSRKKRKKIIDQAAAVEILQRYLDSKKEKVHE
ncbi:MAG: Holliday junction resolvase RuvX [Erysipelothrix sp.]|nr:Holliday junction resolvase RuvX [Erysipelothrix sp.]